MGLSITADDVGSLLFLKGGWSTMTRTTQACKCSLICMVAILKTRSPMLSIKKSRSEC